jgi:hypothetical protein
MKIYLLLAMFALPALCDPSAITGSCKNGGEYPHCAGGEIVFNGSEYPAQVHITVTNGSGQVIDDGDYTTESGNLSFTENLSFADTYSISVNGKSALVVKTD